MISMKIPKKGLIIIIMSLAVLAFLAGAALFVNAPIKASITVEAGERELKQSDFYKNAGIYELLLSHNIPLINCKPLTDLNELTLNVPGLYSVQFLVNGKTLTSMLEVTDTEEPILIVKEAVIATGEKCREEDFIEEVKDSTETVLEIKGISKYNRKRKAGIYEVKITATDLGGNRTTANTLLYALDVKKTVKAELGSEDFPAEKFLKSKNLKIRYRNKFDIKGCLNREGKYTVPLTVLTKNGKKDIDLRLKVADTTPPKIMGVRDKNIYIGSPVSYRNGVYVKDNQKDEIAFKVDASKVNVKKEGVYTVKYSASDKAGNKTVKKVKVVVMTSDKSHEAEVDKYVKDTLRRLTHKGMSNIDKLRKIFDFCHDEIRYTGISEKGNAVEAAYNGFRTHTGDCFTYYATAAALINGAGFENIMVTRDTENTDHFWNLIKYDGSWYHFDTCPLEGAGNFVPFMLCDRDLEKFSKEYSQKYPSHEGYYDFREDDYPERAEKSL